jgi:hypothetical protein
MRRDHKLLCAVTLALLVPVSYESESGQNKQQQRSAFRWQYFLHY